MRLANRQSPRGLNKARVSLVSIFGLVLLSACTVSATTRSQSPAAGTVTVPSTTEGTPTSDSVPISTLPPTTVPTSVASGGSASTDTSCHATGSGLYVLPDPSCTPGATDSAVTQANIDQTICSSGWTSTVRPAESYTENLKSEQMSYYGDTGPISTYEEDHLIPLELGGSPTSPQNLWPEPGASPNPKDSVENAANSAVCDGQMTLASAQTAIAQNWITFGQQLGVPAQPSSASAPAASSGTCTVTASYSTQYDDYDVYVHSNQPTQTAKVTTSGGASASYGTDSTGYADVYLYTSGDVSGQSVTVTVGTATCSTTLP